MFQITLITVEMLLSILGLKQETKCFRITREPEASLRSDQPFIFAKIRIFAQKTKSELESGARIEELFPKKYQNTKVLIGAGPSAGRSATQRFHS